MATATLEQLEAKAATIDIKPIEPVKDIIEDRKREAYEKAGLTKQLERHEQDCRVSAIERAGFPLMSMTQAATLMTGKKYFEAGRMFGRMVEFEKPKSETDTEPMQESAEPEESNTLVPSSFFRSMLIGIPMAREASPSMEPFVLRVKRWLAKRASPESSLPGDMVCAPMTALRTVIPYGVVLRTNELKDAKVFDFFVVVAPREMMDTPVVYKDPVVLGCIGELERFGGTKIHHSFFVAKWG